MEKDTIEEGSLAWRMLHEYDDYKPEYSNEDKRKMKKFWDSIPRIPDDDVEDW